jgi:hypothetical protein
MKDTLQRLEHYLKAVSTKERPLRSGKSILEETFPQLAVVFTKALPKTSQFDMHHIFIDVSVSQYEPVSMHVLLKASTTSNMASETTFFGANVLPSVPRHGPRYCERITELELGENAYIRQPNSPVIFPTDSGAVHRRNPDFNLELNLALGPYGSPSPCRSQAHTKETFEALLAALPARKQGSELCQLKLHCLQGEIAILCSAVSVTE